MNYDNQQKQLEESGNAQKPLEHSADIVQPQTSNQTAPGTSTSIAEDTDKPKCAVCGEENAKMHYGVLACLGCKGFFRRALKKLNEYECLRSNNCIIDKHERNSCRSCRLQKCLDVGMDPAAVRPDRDFTGKQQLARRFSHSKGSSNKSSQPTGKCGGERKGGGGRDEETTGNWAHRLPVEMRTMVMTLQNIEAKVVHGDTAKDAAEIYPLRINTIREIIEEPTKLRGRRTEMRYEPYRMAKNEEFSVIVYRRLIAAIDWVEMLAERMGGLSIEDRIALVKSCFGPLTLFKCSARTAVVTSNENLLCLCNFAYVPREINKAYNDAYHLENGLVDRLLNELVAPFRKIHLAEEEIVVCVSAIIVLNPMARDLSENAAEKVFQLRNRVYTTLYQIIKECRPNCNTNSTFGNLLLYLPIITSLANAMSDNLRFAQTFSAHGGSPLLTSLFGCFPVEPFMDSEMALVKAVEGKCREKSPSAAAEKYEQTEEKKIKEKKEGTILQKQKRRQSDAGTQTEWKSQLNQITRKRRLCSLASVEESNEFRLLKAPCSYTLTEMFDDRINSNNDDDGGGGELMEDEKDNMEKNDGNNATLSFGMENRRLIRTTSYQQVHQQKGIDEQQEFRRPSATWTNAPSQNQSHCQQQQQTQNWPQQQGCWQNNSTSTTRGIPAINPPTTQIQGLFLNEPSSSSQQQHFQGVQHYGGGQWSMLPTTSMMQPNYPPTFQQTFSPTFLPCSSTISPHFASNVPTQIHYSQSTAQYFPQQFAPSFNPQEPQSQQQQYFTYLTVNPHQQFYNDNNHNNNN